MEKIRVMLNSQDLASVFTAYEIFDVFDVFDLESPNLVVEAAKCSQPDVILCAVNSEAKIPIQLIAALKGVCPLSVIILLAHSAQQYDVLNAINAGVDSYLLYPDLSPSEIVGTVELIYGSKVCFFPKNL